MAGIYIHIPYCKQACYYCDFHFRVSLKQKDILLKSILKEIQIRKNYIENETIETIYFGGGTPSILTIKEIDAFLTKIYKTFNVENSIEITLEANPNDLNKKYLAGLKQIGINRLSIGVQSFNDSLLKVINRMHTGIEAMDSVVESQNAGFNNISIDLMYGLPGLTLKGWEKTLQKAFCLEMQHLSAYHLTIEPKTAFGVFFRQGKLTNLPSESDSLLQFKMLIDEAEKNKFIHYEVSNFAKKNFISKHNTNYWIDKKYLGVGPSAHSYNLISRQWNISNNSLYIKAIEENKPFFEKEILSKTDKFNDYILTSLRTMWGVDVKIINNNFGENYLNILLNNAKVYIKNGDLKFDNNKLYITPKGKFITDKITSDLFIVYNRSKP